jgi:hypothetical protein
MPIRFRCSYCNQLLGISRRKIGSLVRCPTCAGQVVVPVKSTVAAEAPGGGSLFERNDFDELLEIPAAEQASKMRAGKAETTPPKAVSPEGAWGTHGEPAFDLEKLYPSSLGSLDQEAQPKSAGIVLSPYMATVLTVAMIFLLAIAFGAGILVDRLLLQ